MRVMGNNFQEVAPDEFSIVCDVLKHKLKLTTPMQRGRWQSQDVAQRPEMSTHELHNVVLEYVMPASEQALRTNVEPSLPWANDHFLERVSGEPLNPPPSNAWWPYAQKSNGEHKSDGVKFSHTYPERFWPKRANPEELMQFRNGRQAEVNVGIRYAYGDLADVVELLRRDPFTRQAFLPVWFPEDTGAMAGERVPCSLGYHFVRNGSRLDCNYFMRSCDYFRHFRDDVYLAVRLTGWIRDQLLSLHGDHFPTLGKLTMFVSNLHAFKGDEWRLNQ